MKEIFLWVMLILTAAVSIYFDNELYLYLPLGILSLIVMVGISFLIYRKTDYKKSVSLILCIVLFLAQWWFTETIVMVLWAILASASGQLFAP